jgi:guanylate kinase
MVDTRRFQAFFQPIVTKSALFDHILIFIKPPSMELLTERLKSRKTETSETFAKRLERFSMELDLAKEFDRCIINDDLKQAISEVDDVIRMLFTNSAIAQTSKN